VGSVDAVVGDDLQSERRLRAGVAEPDPLDRVAWGGVMSQTYRR
jgi:hypothetical protein